ncbi:PDR/VanB family oxidoreductase [Paraburkholderia tuberum]|uniref:Vanillate demethylase subunit B n=1 Tax=Paraburkholderia tuberum TaxID=157910 RepID=A0A1H1KFA1_9BURK|nr:PDR/VanB family oxidoreductase [Paraburkholderia tuberum]SDR60896.1 vanillate demethylase subunit B [Paraburkholderia tuberum]
MSDRHRWTDAVVKGIHDLTPTVREFEIEFSTHVAALPGAHIKVQVLVGGQPDTRSYSVVSVHDNVVTIAVKLLDNSRGGSRYMWSLREGANLRATFPVSDFQPTFNGSEYLLIAGGIGVTPIVNICRALTAEGEKVRVAYCVRSRSEAAYLTELQVMMGDAVSVHAADEGQFLDITSEINQLQADGQVYLCGPIGLMDAVRECWQSSGRPRTLLRYETFGSSGHFAAQAFKVRVPRLSLELDVPAERSMLDVLNEAGAETLFECRRGECGLCAVSIVSVDGPVDHRDVFFSGHQHAENKRMCSCVSRVAGGTVTIETAWRGDPDLSVPEVLQKSEYAASH